MQENANLGESSTIASTNHREDGIRWFCHTTLKKFNGDSTDPADLYDTVEIAGNLMMFGGASKLWEALMGRDITAFDNANSAIGVGDSTGTPAVATLNDLVASSNKLRKVMDATYPQHTDGTAQANSSITFRSTYGVSEANYVWNEWGVFNSSLPGAGTMLNRKVESLGTKASGSTWQLTVTLTIA